MQQAPRPPLSYKHFKDTGLTCSRLQGYNAFVNVFQCPVPADFSRREVPWVLRE